MSFKKWRARYSKTRDTYKKSTTSNFIEITDAPVKTNPHGSLPPAGLIALTRQQLMQDPLSGHLFMFVNRRGNFTKILYFDRTGYCIWSKKLAQGTFHFAQSNAQIQVLDTTTLKFILEGFSTENINQFKRFSR